MNRWEVDVSDRWRGQPRHRLPDEAALDDAVVGAGFNQSIGMVDPKAHAGMVALRAAARASGNYRLIGATVSSSRSGAGRPGPRGSRQRCGRRRHEVSAL